MKDRKYYQEKIDLTPPQKKAWAALERAVKRCRKENIYFYQEMENLAPLNGHNVKMIRTTDDVPGLNHTDPNYLGFLVYPLIETACSFADDDHYVILKDEI